LIIGENVSKIVTKPDGAFWASLDELKQGDNGKWYYRWYKDNPEGEITKPALNDLAIVNTSPR
jgi:hypothetical protein